MISVTHTYLQHLGSGGSHGVATCGVRASSFGLGWRGRWGILCVRRGGAGPVAFPGRIHHQL